MPLFAIGPGARGKGEHYIHIVDLYDGPCPQDSLERFEAIMARACCEAPEGQAAILSEVADFLPGLTQADVVAHVAAANSIQWTGDMNSDLAAYRAAARGPLQ